MSTPVHDPVAARGEGHGTRWLAGTATVVAAVGVLASAVFVRALALGFRMAGEPATREDHHVAATGFAASAVMVLLLAVVVAVTSRLARSTAVVLVVLAGVGVAVAVLEAQQGVPSTPPEETDPAGAVLIMLLVPTSWPLLGALLVLPVVRALRGPSSPAPR